MQIKQTLTSVAKSFFELILEDPEVVKQKEKDLEETITNIVNIRTPGLSPDSDEFDTKYDEVLSEVSNMHQGKHRYFLLCAEELLKQEQQKRECPLKIVK